MALTTEDVLAVIARSPQNWGVGRHQWLRDELAELAPTAEAGEIAAAVLPALDHEDRNVRVRAVWALSVLDDPRAATGIERALHDPARRVREVALKSVRPHHAASPEVWRTVQAMADDPHETNRLRQQAFFVLSSSVVAAGTPVPDVAEDTLRSLMDSERFRSSLLVRLCSASHRSPAARSILHEFVASGTKEEAVMATRALCGQRLMRVDAWLPAELRQRVRETYDPAPDVTGGVTLYWLPVDDARALAEEVGYPRAP